MYEFNAILKDNQTIEITSNTYWSCKVDGNFKLSKYCGEGGTEEKEIIDIIMPDDIMTAEGVVYFSYGDERCEYPQIYVYFANECYISTSPSYSKCEDEENKILFSFNEPGEIFMLSVFCFGNWEIKNETNITCITSNNEIMVISGEGDGSFYITPNLCDKNSIKVVLKRKAD